MRNVFMTFLDQNAPVNSLSFVCTDAQINQFLSLPAISCFAGCTYMWPLQIFCCICKVPGTFLNQNVSRVPKIFGIYAIDLCPKNPFFWPRCLGKLSLEVIYCLVGCTKFGRWENENILLCLKALETILNHILYQKSLKCCAVIPKKISFLTLYPKRSPLSYGFFISHI